MKNIIISGCSYSHGNNSYGKYLNQKYGYDVTFLTSPGQSNTTTIYKLYNHIYSNNIRNSFIICQLTWLHRFGVYSNILKNWVDYQPNAINKIPLYDTKKDFIDFSFDLEKTKLNFDDFQIKTKTFFGDNNDMYEMQKMYKLYLKYHYDESETFNYLLYQIDTLESFVNNRGNQIFFLYWPILENTQITELNKRNFLKIENEYSLLRWSTKTNLLNGKSSHLSNNGHEILGEIIYKYIKQNYNE